MKKSQYLAGEQATTYRAIRVELAALRAETMRLLDERSQQEEAAQVSWVADGVRLMAGVLLTMAIFGVTTWLA